MRKTERKSLRIGYQGEIGSNSELAAEYFAGNLKVEGGSCELIPLENSRKTVKALAAGEIDYAVLAVHNNIGGVVEETRSALEGQPLSACDVKYIRIGHALFCAEKDAVISDIKRVVSHPQAIRQCALFFSEYLPQVNFLPSDDTAEAAIKLKNGLYPPHTAIICRKETGLKLGLTLLKENIENLQNSQTMFRLYTGQGAAISFDNGARVSFFMRVLFVLAKCGKAALPLIAVGTLASCAGIALMLSNHALCLVCAAAAAICFLLAAAGPAAGRYYAMLRTVGCWKYYSTPKNNALMSVMQDSQRIVKIFIEHGKLKMNGWICAQKVEPLCESKRVFISDFDESCGELIYRFGNENYGAPQNVIGVARLEWKCVPPLNRLDFIEGAYLSAGGAKIGTLTYYRITESEFYALRNRS